MLKSERHALATTQIDIEDYGDRGFMTATIVTQEGTDFTSKILGIPPTCCLIQWTEQKYSNPFVSHF